MNSKYLECWKLTKKFPTPTGILTAVLEFNLTVSPGEFVSIIGHSGCGKSTVLQMIAGLHTLTSGSVILDNVEIADAGPDRAVVFQSPNLLPWMTALENVQLGVDQVMRRKPHQERVAIATHYLELVGLASAMHKRPAELSQGMQQRVGIARAFALKPKLLLLDEPFGMLDALTRLELQDALLNVWREDRITAMMVTHDVDEAVFLSDRVVMMTNGPEARVGKILEIDFPRPRGREIAETVEYVEQRDAILAFLEAEDDRKSQAETNGKKELPVTASQPRLEHVLIKA